VSWPTRYPRALRKASCRAHQGSKSPESSSQQRPGGPGRLPTPPLVFRAAAATGLTGTTLSCHSHSPAPRAALQHDAWVCARTRCPVGAPLRLQEIIVGRHGKSSESAPPLSSTGTWYPVSGRKRSRSSRMIGGWANASAKGRRRLTRRRQAGTLTPGVPQATLLFARVGRGGSRRFGPASRGRPSCA